MSASGPRLVSVVSHGRPEETQGALRELGEIAAAHDAVLVLDANESTKFCEDGQPVGVRCGERLEHDVFMCVALGGDGTVLRALREYARTGIPVFGVNFGEVGFLATVEPAAACEGFELALAGKLDLLELPAIEIVTPNGNWSALNDVAVHRKVGGRVAELSYALTGEDVSSVRCDGLVIATPAGSTGYNLANGGPVLAWGVQGMVMSFIAPHSLSARALVIAPSDVLTVHNSSREPLDLLVDGRPVSEVPVGATLEARFALGVATLAQMTGASFYKRLREKFGRLAR
ncbi:MAG: NAD(+)/NADH kinase [Solirubrobacteraceae bacterium]|jgi:NAD+ kinase